MANFMKPAGNYTIIALNEQYCLGNELGKGGNSIVYECYDKYNDVLYACKRIKLSNLSTTKLNDIEKEIDLLTRVSHENIVKYYKTFRTGSHLFILLEYMENRSLAHLIQQKGKRDEQETRKYVTEILEGLIYLHERNIFHCDIKGANILLDKNFQAKLTDFGVSKVTNTDTMSNKRVVGTPYWMAPEMIQMSTDVVKPNPSYDIWSLGCTVIELLTTKPPFHELPPLSAMYRLVNVTDLLKEIEFSQKVDSKVSEQCITFLNSCFVKDWEKRKAAKEMKNSEWLKIEKENISTIENVKKAVENDHRESSAGISEIITEKEVQEDKVLTEFALTSGSTNSQVKQVTKKSDSPIRISASRYKYFEMQKNLTPNNVSSLKQQSNDKDKTPTSVPDERRKKRCYFCCRRFV